MMLKAHHFPVGLCFVQGMFSKDFERRGGARGHLTKRGMIPALDCKGCPEHFPESGETIFDE
jgi:hypothetical protein